MIEELRDAMVESWKSFWSLGIVAQRCVVGAIVGFGVATFLAWKVMIPLILFAFATTIYIRWSNRRGEL